MPGECAPGDFAAGITDFKQRPRIKSKSSNLVAIPRGCSSMQVIKSIKSSADKERDVASNQSAEKQGRVYVAEEEEKHPIVAHDAGSDNRMARAKKRAVVHGRRYDDGFRGIMKFSSNNLGAAVVSPPQVDLDQL